MTYPEDFDTAADKPTAIGAAFLALSIVAILIGIIASL